MTENKSRIKDSDCLDAEQRYLLDDILFIVKPIFKTEGRITLATVLLTLMQGEVEST